MHPLPDFVKKLIVLPNGFVVAYTGTFDPISDPFRLPAAMRDASTIFSPFPPAQRFAIESVVLAGVASSRLLSCLVISKVCTELDTSRQGKAYIIQFVLQVL